MMRQKKEAEIKFFNQFGRNRPYEVLRESGYQRLIKEFLRYIAAHKGSLRTLDLGCGTGSLTSRLHKHGFDLTGVDISPECISRARTLYPHIEFMTGDIEKINFSDETFDIIFLSGVMHHFPDLSIMLGECYRILKKGGILFGYDPNGRNPFMWLLRAKESPFYSSRGITENERLIEAGEIYDALVSCGFSKKKVYSISGITYRYIDSSLSFFILPVYNFIETIVDLTAFRNTLGSMLITYAEK